MSRELQLSIYGPTIERLDKVLRAQGRMPAPGARTAPGLASPVDQARLILADELLRDVLAALLGESP